MFAKFPELTNEVTPALICSLSPTLQE